MVGVGRDGSRWERGWGRTNFVGRAGRRLARRGGAGRGGGECGALAGWVRAVAIESLLVASNPRIKVFGELL